VDYDDLGEDKVYNEQTGSIFDGFKFSFSGFNAEADRGVQIISLICLVCFLIGPNQAWLQVDNTTTVDDQTPMAIHSGTTDEFNAIFFSDYWEITTFMSNGTEVVVNNEYENPQQCTDEVMDVYNCNYRSSLFGTMKQLLTLSALFCFVVFILNFRAEKYRKGIAIFFSLCLVTTMASLLLFTSLIDNAIESDRHLLDQEDIGACWMDEPRIWGETECMLLVDNIVYTDKATFTPGISFWIILATVSILFIGFFTSIGPLLTMEKRTWTEAIKQNWQVFAMIFVIFFLWRLNELMSNL
jgi:hypothetical protein